MSPHSYAPRHRKAKTPLPPTGDRIANGSPPRDEERRFLDIVSSANLRKTWNQIRKEARYHTVRDPIDWLDWAVTVEATLPQIREDLLSGEYVPSWPARYELPKSKGSYRVITVLNIRDALVYRLICDKALELALPTKVPGAFFSRRHDATPVGRTFHLKDDPYLRFFDVWLRYQQYRTRTMLNRPYEILVVTDITNYFDSIPIDLLMEYLSPLGLPRKAVALLGKILDAFKPCAGHSSNPRIGIPVDEYDCSREIAHVFLFEHDRRIAGEFGEENYVRWMDDQNVGARSLTDARKIVNRITRSLSSQRLTLNSGKSEFLTPSAVVEHFQLDANKMLDKWSKRYDGKLPRLGKRARVELERIWGKIANGPSAEKGHWDKILKRMYGLSAKCDSPILDGRMYEDLVEYKQLDQRIFLSLAHRNRGCALLDLFVRYCNQGESLHEATEASFFEACLLLNAEARLEKQLVEYASRFVRNEVPRQSQGAFGKASAVLCMYWFGTNGRDLADLFEADQARLLPSVVARAWLACMAARRPRDLPEIQKKLVGHPADDVARLSRFLDDLLAGSIDHVGSYKNKKPRWPAFGWFYDVRAWLQLEITSRIQLPKLRKRSLADLQAFQKLARTRQEKRVLKRIARRLG